MIYNNFYVMIWRLAEKKKKACYIYPSISCLDFLLIECSLGEMRHKTCDFYALCILSSHIALLWPFLYSPPVPTTLLSHPSHGVQVTTSLKVHKQSLFCRLCLLRWWSQVSQESEPTSESVFLTQISRFLLSIHDCSHSSCQYVEHDTLGEVIAFFFA